MCLGYHCKQHYSTDYASIPFQGDDRCSTAATIVTDDCNVPTDLMATASCVGRPRSTSIDRVLCYLNERQRLKEKMNICKPSPMMKKNTDSDMEGDEMSDDTEGISKLFTLTKDSQGLVHLVDTEQMALEQDLQTVSKCSYSLEPLRSVQNVSRCISIEKETSFPMFEEKTDLMEVPVIVAQNQDMLMLSDSNCSNSSPPVNDVHKILACTTSQQGTSFPNDKENADSKEVPEIVVQKHDPGIYSKSREVLVDLPANSTANLASSSPSVKAISLQAFLSVDQRTGEVLTDNRPITCVSLAKEGKVHVVKRVFDKKTPQSIVRLTKDGINDGNSDCMSSGLRSYTTGIESANQQQVNINDEEPSKLVIDTSCDDGNLDESENDPNPVPGNLFVSKQDLLYMDATALEFEKYRHEMSNLMPWHPIQYCYYSSKVRNSLNVDSNNTGLQSDTSTGNTGHDDDVRNNEYFMLMLNKQRFMSLAIPGGIETGGIVLKKFKQEQEAKSRRHFFDVENQEDPEKVNEIREFFNKIYQYDFMKEIAKEYVIKEPYKTIIFDEEVVVEPTSKGMKLVRPFIVYRLFGIGGERRNSCPLCDGGKEFSSNSKLHNHLELHAGIKLYKCFICSKRFMRKQGLTDHAKQHAASQK